MPPNHQADRLQSQQQGLSTVSHAVKPTIHITVILSVMPWIYHTEVDYQLLHCHVMTLDSLFTHTALCQALIQLST